MIHGEKIHSVIESSMHWLSFNPVNEIYGSSSINDLPYGLKIAAKCEALDLVEKVPINTAPPCLPPVIEVKKEGPWQARLARNAVKYLRKDIHQAVKNSEPGTKPKMYIMQMAMYKELSNRAKLFMIYKLEPGKRA